MSSDACAACGAAGLAVFYEQRGVPVQSVALLETVEEARALRRGDIALALCHACGFVTNAAYDPSLQDYTRPSEESQAFSPRFRAFSHELAGRLVEHYDIRGKTVLEAGCGRGDFLVELCELGGNRGVGIDPSWAPGRLEHPPAVEFVRAFYDERQAAREADLVLCRHTLEHIRPVAAFVRLLRRPAEPRGGVVVIEVPDLLRVLEEGAFWDVYYEHCSYFTRATLAGLAERCGLRVLDNRLEFDDQYVVLVARPGATGNGPVDDGGRLRVAVERFASDAPAAIARWRARLREAGRVALWGASSKAVAFVTAVGDEAGIELAVDINPHKHGRHLAGGGQEIVAPDRLRERRPDLVIAMNPIYREEIAAALRELGLSAELETL